MTGKPFDPDAVIGGKEMLDGAGIGYLVNIRDGQIVGTTDAEVPNGTYARCDYLPSDGGALFRTGYRKNDGRLIPFDLFIAGKSVREWQVYARTEDYLDHMVPSDLRQIISQLAQARGTASLLAQENAMLRVALGRADSKAERLEAEILKNTQKNGETK